MDLNIRFNPTKSLIFRYKTKVTQTEELNTGWKTELKQAGQPK